MLTIKNKVKQGTKVYYTCTDENNSSKSYTKDEIVEAIKQGKVSNARLQYYKEQTIIRVKDDIPVQNSNGDKVEKQVRQSNKKIYAIDIFKQLMKEFHIQDEEEALSLAFDKYSFDLDLEIDVNNKELLTKIRYIIASDLKIQADKENDKKLAEYKETYLRNKTQ
jgi:hypothetical protein